MLITDVRNYPSLADVEDLNLPVAHADIGECTTYAVVCRLRSSPPFTITSFGGSFNHPDYPDVTVTIPENAVPSGTKFSVQFQVDMASIICYLVEQESRKAKRKPSQLSRIFDIFRQNS